MKTEVKTTFNVKHNQTGCYGYNHKKGVYLKHIKKEVIVLCLGSMWDNDYFKGIIIFSGGDNQFKDESKKLTNFETPSEFVDKDAFIENCNFYCEVGDIFDTLPTNEFTLFEGEFNMKQYDK